MELNRNQFFLVGVLLVLLGIQFRSVENFTLNEKTTRFLATRFQDSSGSGGLATTLPTAGSMPRKVVPVPPWLGFALLSVGTVLVLHSLAMPKPGGG